VADFIFDINSAVLNALETPVRRVVDSSVAIWYTVCMVGLMDAGVIDCFPVSGSPMTIDEIVKATDTDRSRLSVYLQGAEDIHLVQSTGFDQSQLSYSITDQGKLLRSDSNIGWIAKYK
jgi:hypothetical protein